MKKTVIAFVLFLLASVAFAQGGRKISVTGTVTDSQGTALPGAVIMVDGNTASAVTTRSDGTYSISVGKTDVLLVSMMGYKTQVTSVAGRPVIDFVLEEDSTLLEEAIVEVGYGEQRVVDLTGTVSRVKVDDVIKAPVVSFDQALQGRIAGVQVSSSDGQPGSDMEIVIRGANSLTQSNAPLYVVDGFPMEDFSASMISSSDIASITVLKDASSTAIYGSRAANGVVIIETKKGKQGKPTVSYNGMMGFQQVTRQMNMMNAYEFVKYQLERTTTAEKTYLTDRGMTLEDYRSVDAVNWQDKVFRNAPIMSHNVSIIGGNKDTRYSVSGTYADQEGVVINSGYQKVQGRFAFEQRLSDKMRFKANASYLEDKTYGQTSSSSLSTNNSYTTYLMYRTWAYKPILLDNQDVDDLFDDDIAAAGIANTVMNPVISNKNELINKRVINFTANGSLEYNILEDLKLVVRGGYNKKISRNEAFYNSKTYQGYSSVNNSKDVNGLFNERINTTWLNENTLTWAKVFDNHRFDIMGGFSMQENRTTRFAYTVIKVPDESLGLSGMDEGLPETVTALLSSNRLMSFIGRTNYSYKGRYLFTASVRGDGSSKFVKGRRWGFFPSGAIAWRMGEEDFIKKLGWVDESKLRLSYGVTGNNRVDDFSAYGSLVVGDYYAIGNSIAEAITTGNLGNRDLTWERTTQWDLGYDLGVLDNRIRFTADVYRKVTDNMLLDANVPYSSGYTSIYKNIGKIRNDGLELSLSTVNVKTRNFTWTSDFNISFNRDKVLELSEGEESLLSKVTFTGDFNNTYLYIAQVGKPVASFYGYVWDGVYSLDDFDVLPSGAYVLKNGVPSNGNARGEIKPGDIKYKDLNGDMEVNSMDLTAIGRATPVHTGGFNNNFTYKGFGLSVFFQWSYGNKIMNANRIVFEGNFSNRNINQFQSYADRWSMDNQDSRNFRVGGQGPTGMYSTRTLEDGSFLRLKTVQFSYTIPARLSSKIGIKEAKVFVSGQNLFTLSSYSGLDPEVSTRHSALTPGFDYSAYARNKIFTGGINITF